MTHDEMIAVIQAHKEGKTIQVRSWNKFRIGASDWYDRPRVVTDFNFVDYEYRIKPEKKVVYVLYDKNDRYQTACLRNESAEYTKREYEKASPAGNPYRIVKMVEEE